VPIGCPGSLHLCNDSLVGKVFLENSEYETTIM
jgi:hypothetical protein